MKQTFKRSHRYILELYESLDANRALGLLDPLTVAWEIIPYSFVIDWFVPIGTYFENLNTIPALNGRWMVVNKFGTESQLNWSWVGPYPLCGYHAYSHRYQTLVRQPRITRQAAYYSRTILGGSPEIPMPSFTQGFEGKRIFNAIALAQQRFKR
jgi:hypothetical protein